MPNEKVNTLTGRMNPPQERREMVPIDPPPPIKENFGILMPDKLKEAINLRRAECNRRLQAAEQRENAAFQESAMTLVQGWLCSQEITGSVSIDLDALTITPQP